MTESDIEWKPLLKSLVDQLVADGHLRSDEWINAFSATPRHVFVPQVRVMGAEDYRVLSGDEPGHRAGWLSIAYSDDSLVVQDKPHAAGYRLPSGDPLRVPTSSSTMPSLMARMLETLDVHAGHRVLEIGTGTGYNAALLSHRLSASNVVSVDIDPGLVGLARERLAELGHRPILVAGDGTAGVPDHGPYDRIISTAAVPCVPLAWIEQLVPGGKILANVRGDLAGGTLCLLTKEDGDEVIGPILPVGGHFMWVRPGVDNPHRPHEHTAPASRAEDSRTTTRLDPSALVDDDGFRFLLQLQLPGARSFRRGRVHDPSLREERDGLVVTAADGSRAEIFTEPEPEGTRCVVQSGLRRLWDTVEATERLWRDLGKPTSDRFGIVANDSTQFVWLDDDHNWYRWPLPLV